MKMEQNDENQRKQAKNSREGRCTVDLQVGTAVHRWPKPRTASTAVRGAQLAVHHGTAVRGARLAVRPGTAVRRAWVSRYNPFSGVCSRGRSGFSHGG